MNPATFARFGAVGASGALVNTAAFWTLTSVLHLASPIAAAFAFELALAGNFTLNHRWTFVARAATWQHAFARYQLAALGGLVVQLASLALLTQTLRPEMDMGLENYTLFGHSFGGMVALKYAAGNPVGLRRLILSGVSLERSEDQHLH